MWLQGAGQGGAPPCRSLGSGGGHRVGDSLRIFDLVARMHCSLEQTKSHCDSVPLSCLKGHLSLKSRLRLSNQDSNHLRRASGCIKRGERRISLIAMLTSSRVSHTHRQCAMMGRLLLTDFHGTSHVSPAIHIHNISWSGLAP